MATVRDSDGGVKSFQPRAGDAFVRKVEARPGLRAGLRRAQVRLEVFGQAVRVVTESMQVVRKAMERIWPAFNPCGTNSVRALSRVLAEQFAAIARARTIEFEELMAELRRNLLIVKDAQDAEWRAELGTEPPQDDGEWMQAVAEGGLWREDFGDDKYGDLNLRFFIMRCRPAIVGALRRLERIASQRGILWENGQPDDNLRETWRGLSPTAQTIVLALHELEQHDPDATWTQDEIVRRALPPEEQASCHKRVFAKLSRRRILLATTGRGGGYQLAPLGRRLAIMATDNTRGQVA